MPSESKNAEVHFHFHFEGRAQASLGGLMRAVLETPNALNQGGPSHEGIAQRRTRIPSTEPSQHDSEPQAAFESADPASDRHPRTRIGRPYVSCPCRIVHMLTSCQEPFSEAESELVLEHVRYVDGQIRVNDTWDAVVAAFAAKTRAKCPGVKQRSRQTLQKYVRDKKLRSYHGWACSYRPLISSGRYNRSVGPRGS